MSDHVHHCPFLNRSDSRCSTNFSLEQLDNAYDYCFGHYSECPVYMELLVERQSRRAREAAALMSGAPRTSRWQTDADSDAATVPITHSGRRIQLV